MIATGHTLDTASLSVFRAYVSVGDCDMFGFVVYFESVKPLQVLRQAHASNPNLGAYRVSKGSANFEMESCTNCVWKRMVEECEQSKSIVIET